MGLFDGLVEAVVQGATWGLSDKVGITGKGGAIHDTDDDPESQSVLIDNDGVYFIASKIQISWDDVAAIEVLQEDPLVFTFRLKGGLKVYTGWIVDETEDDADWGQLASYSGEQADQLTIDCEAEELEKVAEDLIWAIDLADNIRGTDEHLVVDEGNLFALYSFAVGNCDAHLTDANEKMRRRIWNLSKHLRDCLKAQFQRVEAEDVDVQSAVGLALSCLSEEYGDGVSWQKKKYEEENAAAQYDSNSEVSRDKIVAPLLAADGESAVLGDAKWHKIRKTIICTDKPMALNAFAKSERISGAMIMNAADIEEYNSKVEAEYKLVFQPGHPQNGCTYVQHPFRKNVYFEVNSFHDSIRERKQNELLRILESLGAYSAHVEVRHEQQASTNRSQESHVDTKGSYGVVSGAMSRNTNSERETTLSASQSATKDWTFNPPDKPSLPDDLVFYPTEETWQQLAQSVLRGGLKRAQVDLEYKSEYGITEKYLSDIAASAKSLIPSFEMNLKQGFSSNLHKLETTQWHYVVTFENESGERAGSNSMTAQPPSNVPSSTDINKAEALFAKRAKRYAQSDGHINAEQRADLEAFAQKYGIDEFRMEELIEDAFV